jgi:hypothetical protein
LPAISSINLSKVRTRSVDDGFHEAHAMIQQPFSGIR